MFRNMRRANQLLSEAESEKVLKNCSTGVLAVLGDNGYPYTVPLNYVYANGKIYFHCASDGHKTDALKDYDKVSFCVIEDDEVVPELLATSYRSVIVFGRSKILESDDEKRNALIEIGDKYASQYSDKVNDEIKSALKSICIIEITPEHITGKEAGKNVRQAAEEKRNN